MSFPTDAALPVAASIVTLLISQWYSRRMASDDRAERARQANADRSFSSRENRYVDRRDAVIGMIAAAEDETERIQKFEYEDAYGGMAASDIHEDYMFSTLNAAYAKLVILADPAVGDAGMKLRDAVYACFHGQKDAWAGYSTALLAFQETSRAMLGTE